MQSLLDGTMQHTDIINFWFSNESRPLWFAKNSEFDQEIRDKFLNIYEQVRVGNLKRWEERAISTLALTIILGQFSRNMFRNSKQAFSSDAEALRLAKMAVEKL